MPIPSGYTSGQVVQAVPTGINSAFVVVQPETALTAAATATLDGCFTSSYTNYRLHINATGAATTSTLLQLRTGGVTAATNYNRQYIDANSTSVTAANSTSQTSFTLGLIESDFRNSFIVDIFQPQQAQFTNFYVQTFYSSGASTTSPVLNFVQGMHSAATAYDGFILTFGTNATGSYTLYGYGK